MFKSILLSSLFLGSIAFATETTYTVEGMHCGACAKSIKAQVCKMDGFEKCDVTLGKIMVTPKAGVMISKDQIQAAMTKAGEKFKITGESTK